MKKILIIALAISVVAFKFVGAEVEQERYEKLDENTMKVTMTTTNTLDEFLTLNDLIARKDYLLAQKKVLEEDYLKKLEKLNNSIKHIDEWLLKAEELGVTVTKPE